MCVALCRRALVLALLISIVLPPEPVARAAADPGGSPVRPAAPTSRYDWPLRPAPPQVTRRFDPPPRPWLAGHRGVDLAAPVGATIRSAGAGVVHFAGQVAGRPVVSIAHAGGLRSTYEPVTSALVAGASVVTGDPIGELEPGHTGCPVDACLHWGLRRGAEYLDPLALLGLGRVRLLPITASPGAAGTGAAAVAQRRRKRASSGDRRSAKRSYSWAVL